MNASDAIVVLHAPRLLAAGFVHGFSTRAGCYEPPQGLFQCSQVHGAEVLCVQPGLAPEEARGVEADALVARTLGVTVGVRTADCVPVLLADTATGHVAAVHAGWRGVVRGVVSAAMRALTPHDPSTVVAAIGPSIGPCCFEVGDEVATALAETAGEGVVVRHGELRPHVDLWCAVDQQLHGLGITAVDTLAACTVCSPGMFHSFRRDGAMSGRMLAVIAVRALDTAARRF